MTPPLKHPCHVAGGGNSRRERGLAMVELVVILPVVLLLVMSTAELGRALMQYNTMSKAVRDGARHLANTALLGSTGTVQIDAVRLTETRNLVVFGNTGGGGAPLLPGFAPGDVTVTAAPSASVSVEASYTYRPIFARLPRFGYGADLSPNFNLRTAMIMRAL
jgi:Flp pilus assembly protein TadG